MIEKIILTTTIINSYSSLTNLVKKYLYLKFQKKFFEFILWRFAPVNFYKNPNIYCMIWHTKDIYMVVLIL
jgi:hypothetical protein